MMAGLRSRWTALNRYLLLHHPALWMARAPWLVAGSLLTLGGMTGVAVLLPISTARVPDPEDHALVLFIIAGVVALWWLLLVFRAQLGSPLKAGVEGWSVPLGMSLGLALLGAGPLAYTAVLDARVAGLASVAQLRADAGAVTGVALPLELHVGDSVTATEPGVPRPFLDKVPAEQQDMILGVLQKYSGLSPDVLRATTHVITLRHRLITALRSEWRLGDGQPPPIVSRLELPALPVQGGLDSLREQLGRARACLQTSPCGATLFDKRSRAHTEALYRAEADHRRLQIILRQLLTGERTRHLVDSTTSIFREWRVAARELDLHLEAQILLHAGTMGTIERNFRRIADRSAGAHSGMHGEVVILLLFVILYVPYAVFVVSQLQGVVAQRWGWALAIAALALSTVPPMLADSNRIDIWLATAIPWMGLALMGSALIKARVAARGSALVATAGIGFVLFTPLMVLMTAFVVIATRKTATPEATQPVAALIVAYLLSVPLMTRLTNQLRALRR